MAEVAFPVLTCKTVTIQGARTSNRAEKGASQRRTNHQDAPVKSCFAGPATPAFHQASKGAKEDGKKEFFLNYRQLCIQWTLVRRSIK